MDKKCSSVMKEFIRYTSAGHQLVPLGLHRSLMNERAIQTTNVHLIKGLGRCNPNLPLHLWDRILWQTEITFNLIHTSKMNPRLSSESDLNGEFDFKHTPMEIPVTKVLILMALPIDVPFPNMVTKAGIYLFHKMLWQLISRCGRFLPF